MVKKCGIVNDTFIFKRANGGGNEGRDIPRNGKKSLSIYIFRA